MSLPPVLSSPSTLPPDAEAIRQKYLNHEASIRSVGVLYLIGAVISVFGGLSGLVAGNIAGGRIAGLILVAIGVVEGWLGLKLRQLDPVAKLPATILAVIGLIGFPIGTLISIYILYLLLSEKGKYVFSPEYRDIVAATPHIKYKTSIVIWILCGLLVLFFLFAFFGSFLGRR